MGAQILQLLTFALIGFCLILIVEGLVYALFPDKMKVLLNRMVNVPISAMRSGGILAAAAGFGLIVAMKSLPSGLC